MTGAALLRADVLIAILVMALATYLCRAGGYAVLRAVRVPRFLDAMLRALPGPLFVAYVTPSLVGWGTAGLLGGAIALLAQRITGQIAVAVLSGVAAVALARLAGL